MRFGFEYEEFITERDESPAHPKVVLVPDGFPKDDCGWLIEYRGNPHEDAFQAVGSLKAEMTRVRDRFNEEHPDLRLMGSRMPFTRVPRTLKLLSRRTNTKGLLQYQNLYGRKPTTYDTAGLHISITKEECYYNKDGGREHVYNVPWDYAQFVRFMDKKYAKEIKEAKRVPGFYELKYDGRFEYRSLPITINLWELARVLYNYSF
jgi:hypothetical protein